MWWLLAIPVMGLVWLSLRLRFRWKLDNQQRATRTHLHSVNYNEADVTYETPPNKKRR